MTQGESDPTAFPSIEPLRPRSMLFTLYGDYAYPRGQAIGLRGLVTIGARLGIGQTAVRSAVARLSRQDWLEARKTGNRSSYRLTEAGRRLIADQQMQRRRLLILDVQRHLVVDADREACRFFAGDTQTTSPGRQPRVDQKQQDNTAIEAESQEVKDGRVESEQGGANADDERRQADGEQTDGDTARLH